MFFWRRGPSSASVLFFSNRYLTLAYSVYNTPWFPSISTYSGCAAGVFVSYFLEYSQYAVWAAFSSLRVYALRRSWAWAVLVLLLSLVPPATNLSAFRRYSGLCIASRVSLIIADVIVVGLTRSVTHRHRGREGPSSILGQAPTLSGVMYMNGAVYFVALTTMNALYLVFYLPITAAGAAESGRAGLLLSCLNTTFCCFTAILMTDFLIRLQEAAAGLGSGDE